MFFDSSVRSTRTMVRRPSPISPRSAAIRSSTSASCDRLRRKSASAPRPCTPIRVPPSPPANCSAHAVNASAQRCVRKPSRSAPSMPRSTCPATSSGSIRKYSGGAHGVCEKWPILRSGRSSRSMPGTSVRW
ncbi:hypothetical protein SVIOM74S_04771 [Streptomyces violarus]